MLAPGLAHAYKVGRVQGRTVTVYQSADASSKAIDSVKSGDQIYTGNNPVKGFYKVKTPRGKVGFIPEKSVVFSGSPRGGDARARNRESDGAGHPLEVGARLTAGLTFFNAKEINDRFLITDVANGLGVAGEVLFVLSPKLRIPLRVEYLFKSVEVDFGAGETYSLAVSSVPVMSGVEVTVLEPSEAVKLNLGILAGLGLNTRLVSTAKHAAEPNITVYSSSPFTAILRVGLDSRSVGSNFGFRVAAGYRLLQGSAAAPTVLGNGSSVFTDTAGNIASVPVKLSGPMLEAGITFWF